MNVNIGTPVHTFTGRAVYPLAPNVGDIAIEDIAHHLAALARYVGATREPYSVAQHSVVVSWLCDPADALYGLLHDASEAYIGDVTRGLKYLGALSQYRSIEAQLQTAIYCRFGLNPPSTPETVALIDQRIAINEGRDLFAIPPTWAKHGEPLALNGRTLSAWSPAKAERIFLSRYRVLTGRDA